MKIALITDTHFGARNDSIHFADYFRKFYQKQFFPYLEEHNIKTVIHLGDIVDRRKFINYISAKRLREDFIDPCIDNNIDLHVIIGNHDTYYKSTNEVNAMAVLRHGISYYSNPADVEFDGTRITFMPWINNGNYEDCIKHIEQSNADLLFGHLELSGFEMYRGAINEHGMSPAVFDKYDMVLSGHYHKKSSKGNVHYLGSPYEITWTDYDDPRGFHVFDTETRSLEYIQNPIRMFHKIHYNDVDKKDMFDSINFSKEDLRYTTNTYVKIIVTEKNNPYWFDMLVDTLESYGVADIQVVEDHLNLNFEDDDDIINEAEDTITIIRNYVQSLGMKNATDLERLFFSLYNDVLESE